MWEPDLGHDEILLRELGIDVEGVSSVVTPGENVSSTQEVATEYDGACLCAECIRFEFVGTCMWGFPFRVLLLLSPLVSMIVLRRCAAELG